MTPPFAHAGHWAGQLLYFAPVLAMIGAVAWTRFKQRDEGDRENDV
jgi:hypothetical protein